MSNIRFNDKSEVTSITGAEFIPITVGTNDYKAKVQKLAEYTVSAITIGSSSIESLISANSANISTLSIDVSALEASLGTTALTTSSQVVRDAINEIEANLNNFIGSIIYVAKNTPPIGYLKANGAEVSRTTYANLYSTIGTTFGVGDGSTTFNLPDLRGEFLRGWDNGRGVDVGRVFGSFQSDEIKSHNHNLTIAASFQGSGAGTTDFRNIGSTTFTTNNTGGPETRPRNIALLACIKY